MRERQRRQALAVSHKASRLGIGRSVAPLHSGELFMLENLTVKFNFIHYFTSLN